MGTRLLQWHAWQERTVSQVKPPDSGEASKTRWVLFGVRGRGHVAAALCDDSCVISALAIELQGKMIQTSFSGARPRNGGSAWLG